MSFPITSTNALTWTGPGTVMIRGVEYHVTFSKNGCQGPCLSLTTIGASPVTYPGVLEECDCSYAVFWFGQSAICNGTANPGGPCYNRVAIRVERGPCCDPIPGWNGPGWYCARDRIIITDCRTVPMPNEVTATVTAEAPWGGVHKLVYLPAIGGWVKYVTGNFEDGGGAVVMYCTPSNRFAFGLTAYGPNGTGEFITWNQTENGFSFTDPDSTYGPASGRSVSVEAGDGGPPLTDCHVVELNVEDACDNNIEICSGPYPTQAAAEIGCAVVPVDPADVCDTAPVVSPGPTYIVSQPGISLKYLRVAITEGQTVRVIVSSDNPALYTQLNFGSAGCSYGTVNSATGEDQDYSIVTNRLNPGDPEPFYASLQIYVTGGGLTETRIRFVVS